MKLRNQNGAALVVVLLIITVFVVLGLSIVSSALSNTKQVNKTEQEMQAVDLAEMGILYYQNHFKEKTYKLLKTPIEIAVDDQENNTLDKKIAAVNNHLNKQNLTKELEEYPIQPINDDAKYDIMIKNVSFDNYIISVDIASTGIKNSDTQETIDATIKLSIQQLIEGISRGQNNPAEIEFNLPIPDGLKNCDYTKDLESGCFYDNIVGTANFEGGISKDTIVYINGNVKFDDMNGGINKDSIIYINGEAEFGRINGGIKEVTLYIKNDATFSDVINSDVKDSKICVGGAILGEGIKKIDGNYPAGVYSYQDNSAGYLDARCPPINDQENNIPSNFGPNLINLHTRLNVRYH